MFCHNEEKLTNTYIYFITSLWLNMAIWLWLGLVRWLYCTQQHVSGNAICYPQEISLKYVSYFFLMGECGHDLKGHISQGDQSYTWRIVKSKDGGNLDPLQFRCTVLLAQDWLSEAPFYMKYTFPFVNITIIWGFLTQLNLIIKTHTYQWKKWANTLTYNIKKKKYT
jgi:hypothetical protein